MKKRLQYSLLILLLALINSVSAKALHTIQKSDAETPLSLFVSQAQAQQESARSLYFFYSHSLNGTIVIDNLSLIAKSLIRSSNLLDITKDLLLLTPLSNLCRHSSLHQDAVEYYVFTLEKIIT